MRRFVVLLSVALTVLAGTMSPSTDPAVSAQDASPQAQAASIPPLLVAWAEAWSSGDPERVAAFYTEDAVYKEVPTGIISQGTDEISDFVANTFAAFPGVQVTPLSGFQADDWAVMEADFSGTSADGASFSVPFVAVFELDGDKIVREADYFDLYDFMRQLGTLPGAEATPTA